ncbi:MAG: gliding motility-associated C-terminal domain-containing protein [Bacteroidota bacterium]|nr:gliding motility-associated C-terminal domain-containing protein [Bacteroidota bacterium]
MYNDPVSSSGCAPLLVNFAIKAALSTGDTVRWNFGDGTTNTKKDPQYLTYQKPGIYKVTLKVYSSSGTPKADESVEIKVGLAPIPTVEYKDSTIEYNVALRATLKDYSSPFLYTYVWSQKDALGSTIFHTDASVPNGTDEPWFLHDFGANGTYTLHLKISDELGCTFEGDATIDAWNKIEAPNVFTPNDDGKNDEFVVNSNGTQTLSLKVYTRAGVLVYETEAKRIRWDGRMSSGEKVSTGVYFYIIESKEGANVKKTGFVYIYR